MFLEIRALVYLPRQHAVNVVQFFSSAHSDMQLSSQVLHCNSNIYISFLQSSSSYFLRYIVNTVRRHLKKQCPAYIFCIQHFIFPCYVQILPSSFRHTFGSWIGRYWTYITIRQTRAKMLHFHIRKALFDFCNCDISKYFLSLINAKIMSNFVMATPLSARVLWKI